MNAYTISDRHETSAATANPTSLYYVPLPVVPVIGTVPLEERNRAARALRHAIMKRDIVEKKLLAEALKSGMTLKLFGGAN